MKADYYERQRRGWFRATLIGSAIMAQVSMAQTPTSQPTTRPTIMLQADAAERHGTVLATARPGFTGSAYVTGIDGADDRLTWHFHADAPGVYLAELRYSASSPKAYDLVVNGVSYGDAFPATGDAFATHSGGKLPLKAGDNVIELRRGWGHYDIDRIELIPTRVASVRKPPATPVDKNATPEARRLMQRLVDGYGSSTLSGVVSPRDAKLVLDRTGVRPAIMGGDLMDYSPSRVEHNPKSLDPPERLIADAGNGYVITLLWHWNAPSGLIDKIVEKDGRRTDLRWYRGFYTEATTFDVAAAMKDRDGADYKLLLRDIDAIAVQLKKYSDAGVPVLWRPLHEADGRWFWWGAKGPEAFKQLWALTYDRLTNHHGLHNLIWVYTGSANWDWYPPEDQFDLIGVDAYPADTFAPLSATWDAMHARYGNRKMITLSEYGGVPDLRTMADLGVRWAYFVSWNGKQGPDKLPPEELKRRYTAPSIVTLPATTQPGR